MAIQDTFPGAATFSKAVAVKLGMADVFSPGFLVAHFRSRGWRVASIVTASGPGRVINVNVRLWCSNVTILEGGE